MTLKPKIEDISIRTQSMGRFLKDLKLISNAILTGKAVEWKDYNSTRLLNDFQNILVEREFTFYASQHFYSGVGIKRISPKIPVSDSNQSETINSKDTSLVNLKELAPVNLFFLPWLPDPIPLSLALTINWRTNQQSKKSEMLMQRNHLQYTSPPGRARKTVRASNSSSKNEKRALQKICEPLGKIRGWRRQDWNYFPVFFVLAFLTLQDNELRLLKKALTRNCRGYNAMKSEDLQSLCQTISSLPDQANWGRMQNINPSPTKAKAQMMREYIAMTAFMSLISKHQDTAIENLLLLDYLTGLCTALLGHEAMQHVLEIWKSSESDQDHKNNTVDALLQKMEKAMLRTADYNEDNIISKIESEAGFYYPDSLSKVTRKYYKIANCPNYSTTEKLNMLIISQFKEIDKLSTWLFPVSSNQKLLQTQYNSKKNSIDLYFHMRTEFSKKEVTPGDFDKIIKEFIETLKDIDSTRNNCILEDAEEEPFSDESSFSSENESIAFSEKESIPLSVEAEEEISRYKALQSMWIKFFLVRRMQNGEPPKILFHLGHSDINPLADQILEDIACHYPPELWPDS